MDDKKFRVVLLTHGGYEEVVSQILSIERVAVSGIFVETNVMNTHKARQRLSRSIRYDGYAATLQKGASRLVSRQRHFDPDAVELKKRRVDLYETARRHDLPINFVPDFHAEESIKLIRNAGADLGVIMGTNILRESVFKIPRLGSINLHQGRAPYYRGGPPVFWELFNGETEIGITVHYVEKAVDTGQIIIQETVPLIYDYSYKLNYESFIKDFLGRLRGRCVHLVAEAVRRIAAGEAEPWSQEVNSGRRYRLPTKREKDELCYRLRKRQKLIRREVIPREIEVSEDK